MFRLALIPRLLRTGCYEPLEEIFDLGGELRDDMCDGLTTLLQG